MNKPEKLFEMIVCAIGTLLFAGAFFFSIFYPEYGISDNTCKITDEKVYEYYMEKVFDTEDMGKMTEEQIYMDLPAEEIKYKSYFYEKLMQPQN